MKNIILTGDRPTGRLHIGHYAGSLKSRVELQNAGGFEKMYVMIADAQAMTDNFENVNKVRENIIEVALDYLAVGLDPQKVNFFIQSEVAELSEFCFYYQNLVTLSRLQRNPTVKAEIKQKNFEKSLPVGFLTYPISQAADITAFGTTIVPVGADQLPMIEQTNEIVRTFNRLYGQTLCECKALLPQHENAMRLPGLDGKAKMSKSLGNCIFLSDDADTIKQKVMSMFTDPTHLKVTDPGKVAGNTVFCYLDAFLAKEDFAKFLPAYADLAELKAHYKKGGLGDMVIKKFLNSVLQEMLAPIRERRQKLSNEKGEIMKMLFLGTDRARDTAAKNLVTLKKAMGIYYR